MRLLFTAIAVVFSFTTYASDYSTCTGREKVGDKCWAAVASIHPTQFVVGMREVEAKAAKLQEKDSAQLEKTLEKKFAPGVFGPNSQIYITDRHHLARELVEIGYGQILVSIEADYSNLSVDKFWAQMASKNWDYLYDQNGQGPLDPKLLPARIDQMKDDPYRSLVWAVEDKNGIGKSSVPFFEFIWDQFFRKQNIKIGPTDADFNEAVDQAVKLALSPAAKNLPGYVGKP